ncbi:hypothetical protein CYMTET_25912 [Cymbomonas tetramitiformis]|uniref:Uncharacterized protein n=1 Tax=Cymbomonas tetramitiformis TaxID=36881 RepID=A0AAE0KYR9_9CHLO|nr:hypothetical protein CYMTET_25912 [Cymbomonas tetramitiformis]
MGRHRGKYAAEFQCVIKSCDDSGFCGAKRTIYHQAGKAASTSNLVTHVRDMAKKCDFHMLALAAIERNSSKFVEVGGEQVKVFNFSESFEHHVDLLWLRTIGLSFNTTTKDEFRDYVRGFEPRAAFPHSQTIYRLAVCVLELQKTERLERTSRLIKVYVGKACVGLQLDMWTDTSTHTAFAAITQTTIEDPGEELDAEYAQLFLRSEILDFDVFPLCAKTGPNIRTWFARVLERNNLPYSAISGVTPDGAADGHCALNMIPEISEKVDTCILHSMQRGVLYSIGLAGKVSKNPDCRELLKRHNRVVTLFNQSLAFGKSIRTAQEAAKIYTMQAAVSVLMGASAEHAAITRKLKQERMEGENGTLAVQTRWPHSL